MVLLPFSPAFKASKGIAASYWYTIFSQTFVQYDWWLTLFLTMKKLKFDLNHNYAIRTITDNSKLNTLLPLLYLFIENICNIILQLNVWIINERTLSNSLVLENLLLVDKRNSQKYLHLNEEIFLRVFHTKILKYSWFFS